MMEYKGYLGHAELDAEAGVLHGEVVGIRDVVTFRGESIAELRTSFEQAVDFYLDHCAKRGKRPDTPFSGQFRLRLSPDLHRRAVIAAEREGKSLNSWVADCLRERVERAG